MIKKLFIPVSKRNKIVEQDKKKFYRDRSLDAREKKIIKKVKCFASFNSLFFSRKAHTRGNQQWIWGLFVKLCFGLEKRCNAEHRTSSTLQLAFLQRREKQAEA